LLLRRDEESWGRLRQDYQAGPILNHPSLKRLMNDKDWLRTASYANYARLMTLPEVSAALKDSTLVERLRAINVERAAREAIGAVPAQ
jgi:hypothetical protein